MVKKIKDIFSIICLAGILIWEWLDGIGIIAFVEIMWEIILALAYVGRKLLERSFDLMNDGSNWLEEVLPKIISNIWGEICFTWNRIGKTDKRNLVSGILATISGFYLYWLIIASRVRPDILQFLFTSFLAVVGPALIVSSLMATKTIRLEYNPRPWQVCDWN